MATSEQEKADLEDMKQKLDFNLRTMYSDLRSLDRASPDELRMQGHPGKSNAEVMQDRFRYYVKLHDKIIAAHIRKYPD